MSFALYIITYIFVLFYRYTTPRALHSFPTRRSSDLAPLNTYMTHAACAMVRKLRSGAKLGLLYGQGGFVTKHHALVRSEEHTSELQSHVNLVCRLLLEKKKTMSLTALIIY